MNPTDKLNFYNRQLVQRILAQDAEMSRIFNEFVRGVSPYLRKWRNLKKSSVWYHNTAIESAIDKKLIQLAGYLENFIMSEQADAWGLSDSANDAMFKTYIRGMSVSDQVKSGMFKRNMDAMKAFQKRSDAGMNLSKRVWNITEGTKSQLEFYLESGVSQGRSAARISQDVRQILNNPDTRFRRVKNPETGKLMYSQPMADFHPGAGVFRSAYKNALRLASTETNLAYRMSDYSRWKGEKFVMGVDVHLSNAHPKFDICDHMQGRYPKGFQFLGWHPSCICYATPVLLPQEAFVRYLENDHADQRYLIRTLPKRATRYVENNRERFMKYKNPPYWFRDNFTKKGQVRKAVYAA